MLCNVRDKTTRRGKEENTCLRIVAGITAIAARQSGATNDALLHASWIARIADSYLCRLQAAACGLQHRSFAGAPLGYFALLLPVTDYRPKRVADAAEPRATRAYAPRARTSAR